MSSALPRFSSVCDAICGGTIYVLALLGQICPPRRHERRLSSRAMTAFRWALLLTVFMTVLVRAQIPVTKEPHHHVTFENSQFRILDVNVPPGESTLDHSHDRDLVTVSMSNGAETRAQA